MRGIAAGAGMAVALMLTHWLRLMALPSGLRVVG
jgi:hypothetical protein